MPPELPGPSQPRPGRPIGRTAPVSPLADARAGAIGASGQKKSKGDRVTLDQRQWQNLLDMEDRLAEVPPRIGEPDG